MSDLYDASSALATLNCVGAKLYLAREDEAVYQRLLASEVVPVGKHEAAKLVTLAAKRAAADLGIPVPRIRFYMKAGTSDGVRVVGGGIVPADGTVTGRAYRGEGPRGEIWIALRPDEKRMVLVAVHETAHIGRMNEQEAEDYEGAWARYLDDEE